MCWMLLAAWYLLQIFLAINTLNLNSQCISFSIANFWGENKKKSTTGKWKLIKLYNIQQCDGVRVMHIQWTNTLHRIISASAVMSAWFLGTNRQKIYSSMSVKLSCHSRDCYLFHINSADTILFWLLVRS